MGPASSGYMLRISICRRCALMIRAFKSPCPLSMQPSYMDLVDSSLGWRSIVACPLCLYARRCRSLRGGCIGEDLITPARCEMLRHGRTDLGGLLFKSMPIVWVRRQGNDDTLPSFATW